MLEVSGIHKSYFSGAVETPVLRDVNFHVNKGELIAIMGASGSGKTTLMNILGCLDAPGSGSYKLDGVDVFSHDDDALSVIRNEKIGFVFQQFHLLERVTALDNVILPLIYAETFPHDAKDRGVNALRAVGLDDRMSYRPNQLSGGQQQRVAIARALIGDPPLILADEPTGNLDRRSGLEIMAILQRLNREGRTVVLITHDAIMAEHADRILHLRDGTVTGETRPDTSLDAGRELEELTAERGGQ